MRKVINFIFSFQFSKLLIIFETIIVAYLTYEGVEMAKMCINSNFCGSLPWVATMVSTAWAAYGTSAAFYYNKGKAEQLKKIETTGSEYSYYASEEDISMGAECDESYSVDSTDEPSI